jgi:hypothetical protein
MNKYNYLSEMEQADIISCYHLFKMDLEELRKACEKMERNILWTERRNILSDKELEALKRNTDIFNLVYNTRLGNGEKSS